MHSYLISSVPNGDHSRHGNLHKSLWWSRGENRICSYGREQQATDEEAEPRFAQSDVPQGCGGKLACAHVRTYTRARQCLDCIRGVFSDAARVK